MSGAQTAGNRAPDVADIRQPHPCMKPGEYRKVGHYPPDGRTIWECCTPNGRQGNLRNHTVTEHEDGTITVSPSILIQGGQSWHGYLERGVWRSC